MPSPNPECFHLSASSIAAFKACPQRFRLAYREGLREDTDTDALRVGTNWHAMHEVYRDALMNDDLHQTDDGTPEDHAMAAVVEHLNQRYAEDRPTSKTAEEWDIERRMLLTCFTAYVWYYQDDDIEYLHQELAFDLPLHSPRTGLPLPTREVLRVGKIDHIVRWRGMVGPIERKSTSRAIEPGSDYWSRSRKDTQVSMYALALWDLRESGQLAGLDVKPTENLGNTLYDVWRKPTIKPAKLSQKDTAELLETGKYHDANFEIVVEWETQTEVKKLKKATKEIEHRVPKSITIDGDAVEFEISKTFKPTIRETPALFCARLLADIVERPEFYFQRQEISRSQRELRRFRSELWNIYQSQKTMAKTDTWFENEQQCDATFRCRYMPICYGVGADAVCDGETTPEGFRRIFVDLTVEGQTPGEE